MLDIAKLLKSIGANTAQQLPTPEIRPTADIQNRPMVPTVQAPANTMLNVPDVSVAQNVQPNVQYGRPGSVPVVVAPEDVPTPMGVNDQLNPPGLITQAPPPAPPVLTPLQQAESKYAQDLQEAPKHVSPWMNALFYTLQGINKTLTPNDQPFTGLGTARKNHLLAQDRATLLPLREQAKVQAENDYNKARVDNIYADNDLARARLDQMAADKAVTQEQKATQLKMTARRQFRLNHPSFDPATATPAEKAELAQFNSTPEDMGKYDFQKPNAREIAGKTYTWKDGKYEDTGLDDKGKFPVDITVTNPINGITEVYTTTNEKAAALRSRLQDHGMTIESMERRQRATIDATNQRQERSLDVKARIATLKQKDGDKAEQTLRDKFKLAFFNKYKEAPTEAQIQAFLTGNAVEAPTFNATGSAKVE